MTKEDLLLVQLSEECAEVAQEVSKCLRFGSSETYAPIGVSNINRVIAELNDLMGVIQVLQEEKILPEHLFKTELLQAKGEKVRKLMEYSEQCGRLD